MDEPQQRQQLMPVTVSDPNTAGHYVISTGQGIVWQIERVWHDPANYHTYRHTFPFGFRTRDAAVQQAQAWVGMHT